MSIEAAIWGTLGRDAELKVSKKRQQYLKFGARVGDGDAATWVNVMAFVDGAPELASKLLKGARVYCEGSLRLDEWTAQDGAKRSGLSVMAWRCELPAIGKNRPKRDKPGLPDEQKPSRSNNFHSDEIGF
jgi:single-stranded DNA-binding protein